MTEHTLDEIVDQSIATLTSIADDVKHMFGEAVLVHDTEIALLHGVARDATDVYYVAESLKPYDKDHPVVWYSAVGAIQRLNGVLPDDAYGRIRNIFANNSKAPLPDTFQMLVQGSEAPLPFSRKAVEEIVKAEIAEAEAQIAANAQEEREDLQ